MPAFVSPSNHHRMDLPLFPQSIGNSTGKSDEFNFPSVTCGIDSYGEIDHQQFRSSEHRAISIPEWRLKTLACDVVLTCRHGSSLVEQAVSSILGQQDIQVVLHLVDDGGRAAAFIDRFQHRPNVVVHHNRREIGIWRSLQSLIPQLKSPYLAVQHPNCESRPDRLRKALSTLEAYGGEVFASAVSTPMGLIEPTRPDGYSQGFFPRETLVFRRATLVDLGGFDTDLENADIDFVSRAYRDNRRIIATAEPLVISRDARVADVMGPQSNGCPNVTNRGNSGMGFAEHSVGCDVILPFHGQLEFVRQAIESILEQEGADVYLHLVDDGTPENTDDFLRYWRTHARVRTYRNSRNLGQYSSFNNVVRFCETDLVAVQDGDDVSHPRRLFRAGNHLRLSGAEIFGGSLIEFEGVNRPGGRMPNRVANGGVRNPLPIVAPEDSCLRSEYPVWEGAIEHFLFNGSAVMRIAAFKELGGFSDYGDVLRNRCNLDTEFYARAFFGGRTFAVTREIVSWCRKHPASATRNQITGWGTEIRTRNVQETRRRVVSWRQAPCVAKQFGALDRYESLTNRWPEVRSTYGQIPKEIAVGRDGVGG